MRNVCSKILLSITCLCLSACFGGGGSAKSAASASTATQVEFNALSAESGCTMERTDSGALLRCGDRFAVVQDGARGPKGDPGDAAYPVIRDRSHRVVARVIGSTNTGLVNTLKLRMVDDGFEGTYDAWSGQFKPVDNVPLVALRYESTDCSGEGRVWIGGGVQPYAPNAIVRTSNGRRYKITGRIAKGSFVIRSERSASGSCDNGGLTNSFSSSSDWLHTLEEIESVAEATSDAPDLTSIAPLMPESQ